MPAPLGRHVLACSIWAARSGLPNLGCPVWAARSGLPGPVCHIRLAIRHPMHHQMFGADAATRRYCDPRQEEGTGRTNQPTRQPAHIDDLSTNCQHNNTANRHGEPAWRTSLANQLGEPTRQTDMANRHGKPTWQTDMANPHGEPTRRTVHHVEASYGRRHMSCYSGVICGALFGASHTEPMEIDPKNPS